MKYEAVQQWLIQVRLVAQTRADKCFSLQIGDAAVAIQHKRGGWEYRINGVSYSVRSFEQALAMVPPSVILDGMPAPEQANHVMEEGHL